MSVDARDSVFAGPGRFLPAACGLRGRSVPGDKSVSHRAVLLGAVNDGPVEVTGFLRSADTWRRVAAVEALGVRVEAVHGDRLVVHGAGWEGLREPEDVIDVANSGTLIRLLPGLVASCDFLCVLTGDASIRRRPMARMSAASRGDGGHGGGAARRHPASRSAIRGGDLRGIDPHDSRWPRPR